MPRIFKVLGAREVLKIFTHLGFYLKSQKGSHIKVAIKQGDIEKILTIPNHKEIAQGTLRAIYRQASLIIDVNLIDEEFKNK